MYKRNTSVAIHDFERELSNLIPIDDYYDDREPSSNLKKKRSSQFKNNSGQKLHINRIDLEKVNVEPAPALATIKVEGVEDNQMNTLENEILEIMRYQEISGNEVSKKKSSGSVNAQ
jgi:hypothetical protein